MALSTPIGFLIFNRPDVTERVFSAIASAQPKKLLVVADGARNSDEREICEQTKSIIKKVNWDCDVLTNFSEENLGCGKRISSGLDWIFSEVEEAIILEDDTLPCPSFFTFCQSLLEHYRDDERVMHINGDNSLIQRRNSQSYYFSKYIHIWGWATWRRAWKHYDYNIRSWHDFKETGLIQQIFETPYEQKYWTDIFNRIHIDTQDINTWDYQWIYACWSQGGLAIAPNSNMVSNLGFNQLSATHTTDNSFRANLPTSDIWEIQHPPFVVRQREADNYTFDNIYGGKELKEKDKLTFKLRQRLWLMKMSIMNRKTTSHV